MKDKILITIMDEKGSKQFSLHRVVRRVAFYVLVGFLALVVGCFVLMTYSMKQVKEMGEVKAEMMQNYRALYLQNQSLRNQIHSKSLELTEVSKRVDDLEEIVDFSRNKDVIDEPVQTLPDVKDQVFLLQIIPSGAPVDGFHKIISSKQRIHPLKNRYGVDSGIDFLVSVGQPVRATADGIVELSRKSASANGYGRYVKLTHAYGFSSMYGYLSQVLVKKGDFVAKGQIIGYSGKSGASAGERLYYEVRFLGRNQDALAFVKWDEKNFESIFAQEGGIDWNQILKAIADLKQLQAYQGQNQQ